MSDNSGYTPIQPYSATWTTTLSQDVISTNTIPVDSSSPAPVAPFLNPSAGGVSNLGAMEALVVTGGLLCHVARCWNTDGGWVLNTLAQMTPAREVAAGTTWANTTQAAVYAVYQDDSALQVIRLADDGVTWSAPSVIVSSLHSQLRSTCSPAGKLVVYGQDSSGNLTVCYQPALGEAFVAQTYALPAPLVNGDFQLCLSDESSWTLAANNASQLWIYTGVLDGTSTQPTSFGPTVNYSGTINQTVLGYWSASQSAMMFVFVDTANTLQVWSSSGVKIAPPCPTGVVKSATGHVYLDPDTGIDFVSLYTLDNEMNLSVLHQNPQSPWNTDGSPSWSAYIPLDTGIAALICDSSPADIPSLFALDAADYSLRLHQQDANTQLWMTGAVHQSGTQSYDITRYRAEVSFTDANGIPLAGLPVSVSVADNYSAADLWVAGSIYPVSSNNSTTLTTSALGKLTFAVITTDLSAPVLIVNANGLSESLSVPMGMATHTYLSGCGILNPTNPLNPAIGSGPLPVFDVQGAALQSATVNGGTMAPGAAITPLAAVAAASIQQTAMVGLGTTPVGVAGYQVNFIGPNGPSFQVLPGQDDVRQQLALLQRQKDLGDIWSDIDNFFSDVWQGIKTGAIAIQQFVVSTTDKIATFVLKVGNEIKTGISLALQGIEQAGHFIAGVFNVLEADLKSVLDWLKALFDFGAIWRSKMAFETTLTTLPTYIKSLVGLATKEVDGWFSRQESLVQQAFSASIQQYQGQTFGQCPYYQAPGIPDGTVKVAGGATAADFSNNVHQNWLQDKVDAYIGSSITLTSSSQLEAVWQDFSTNIADALIDFNSAAMAFFSGIKVVIENPTTFSQMAVTDFLTAIGDLAQATLTFCDAIFDGLMLVTTALMDALSAILTTIISCEPLQSLWTWIAKEAGYPEDDELDVAALLALLGAFPTTVIYKLVAGVNQEPFPQPVSSRQAMVGEMPAGARLAAGILQSLYVVPAIAGDVTNENCPRWLSLLLVGASGIIWGVGNGLPDTKSISWLDVSVVVANLLWLAPSAFFILQTLKPTLINWAKSTQGFNDLINGLITAYGVSAFTFHTVEDFLSPSDEELVIAGLLIPTASIMSFTNTSTFRDDPEVAPFALAAKIAFDVIGYLGGGVAEIVDASKSL